MTPKSVQFGPYAFRIVEDELALARDGVENGSHLFGMVKPMDQRITVHPKQGPDMKRDTILHELLHVALMPLGLEEQEEERIVSTISPQLLDCLQRNPDLVTYLTE